jgi:hypothetical protein
MYDMNKSSSARPRRLPETDNKPNLTKLESENNKQNKPNKISIGNAIGLISIRLCKIEERLLKEQKIEETDNANLLKTIFDRLNDIESKQLTITDTLSSVNNGSNISPDNFQINVNDVEIEKLKIEVEDLKKIILKIQEKLLDIIISK